MLATAYTTADMPVAAPLNISKGTRPAAVNNDLAQRIAGGTCRTVEAKEHVFCEGDAATHVYLVEAGHLCIYRMLSDGRRQVIDFAYPGDFVALGALREHTASAQATEKTRLRCYSVSLLHEVARHDPALGVSLYEAISQELNASRELLMTVSQRTAGERVAGFLMALSRRNHRRGENPHEIVLPMTRLDIANFLGLTIETISRTFTKFRNEGLIDLEQCVLVTILDPAGLADLAGRPTSPRARARMAS